MNKVIGLGGPFIKAKDPKALAAWYSKYLGIPFGESTFATLEQKEKSMNIISFFAEDSSYFQPSSKPVMLNLIVTDVFGMIAELEAEGVTIIDAPMDTEYGKFGWILDPEDNKIELWQPSANPEG